MKLDAILFDRDGTLIVDEPRGNDPACIALMPRVADALALAREWGLRIGVVTNQPRITEGTVNVAQLQAVHARVEALAGPLDGWFVCPHRAQDGCTCRKPKPGLILAAARCLGISPERCVVVGDIGSDMEAARAAGAHAVMVPTAVTRREEIDAAPLVADDSLDAVRRIVAGCVA